MATKKSQKKWRTWNNAGNSTGEINEGPIHTVPGQDIPISEFVQKYTRNSDGVMNYIAGSFSDLPEIEKMEVQDQLMYAKYLRQEAQDTLDEIKDAEKDAKELKDRKKAIDQRIAELQALKDKDTITTQEPNSITDDINGV